MEHLREELLKFGASQCASLTVLQEQPFAFLAVVWTATELMNEPNADLMANRRAGRAGCNRREEQVPGKK